MTTTNTTTAATGPATGDRQRVLATAALAGTGTFVAFLALLHIVKSDVDPDWRMVSEYAIGAHGWLMSLAFVVLAASCGALALALHHAIRSTGGRVGLALLWLAALGMVLAGVFTTDPITATSDELTTQGRIHGLGFMLGNPALLVGALLVSRSLVRRSGWHHARGWLYGTTAFAWSSVAIFGIANVAMYDGAYGPDVHVGWPNRLVVVAYCTWLATTAALVFRSRSRSQSLPSASTAPQR